MEILVLGGDHNGKWVGDLGPELNLPTIPSTQVTPLDESLAPSASAGIVRYIKRRVVKGMRETPVYALSSMSAADIIQAYEDR